jgi:tetratricopeptide (TPR) repeat protein
MTTTGANMEVQQKLSIYALGPVQVFRGEQLLTEWAYLDSAELLFYLLNHTRKPKRKSGTEPLHSEDLHGKSREQIGLELWPDASPQQLSSKLKSRLYDLRRVLGDGEWIIFDNGHYKFNATRAYWFDVETFEELVAEGERHGSNSPAKAITCLQEAVQLYRGDYLADLRQRRARREQRVEEEATWSGREWHIAQQEALQSTYQRALHKLGQLLFRSQSFEQAAEIYRLAVAKDDYDDEAHHGLILCLALQGKRSQALEQYRRLVKRRSDTPPGAEIVELAERLKRGEELAPKPPAPDTAQRLVLEQGQATTSAPFQVPTDLPRFVGRQPELDAFRAVLAEAATAGPEAARPYCLAGMGGIGKTSLAVHIAHSLRDQFPDGVLWAHVSTSEPLAILDSWARAYQCDYSGLPDLESRAAALRALLADKKVLMILDDVWNAARARSLLVGGRGSTVLITGRDMDVAHALDAQIVSLPVFAAEESQQLLSRIVGQARVMAEAAAADEICELLGNLPLALDIASHRLASRPRWTLREMVERIRAQQRRLAELKIGDLEVRASFAISWEALSERLRGAFASLGVFCGRALSAPALAAVAGLGEPAAREELDALVALSLLSFENSIYYRQHPLLADFAREHLDEAEAADARMAKYFLGYATEQRQNYLALEQEWDNLAAGIQVAGQQKMWQVIIDYGDVLTNAWFARGRFTFARQAYLLVCEAARELEEQDPYIAATINWARACIEQGDYAEAEERLEHALQTSREVNDQHGAATAQFHLGRVAYEQSNHGEATKLFEESQQLLELLGDQAGVGEVLGQRARIAYRHFNHAAVEQLGKQALDLLRSSDRFQQTIEVLRYLALAADQQGRRALADEYCQQALKLCDDLQYQAELPSVLYTLTQLCYARGDYALARRHGERSLALFKASGDRKALSVALEYLMRVYLDQREFALAEETGKQGLALSQELRDEWGLVYALRGMGHLYMQTERPDEARRAWTEALAQAHKLGHPLEAAVSKLLVEAGWAGSQG